MPIKGVTGINGHLKALGKSGWLYLRNNAAIQEIMNVPMMPKLANGTNASRDIVALTNPIADPHIRVNI